MKRFAALLPSIILITTLLGFSQNSSDSDPYKPTLDRLLSLTGQGEADWRYHADVPHPEDPGLTDSDWTTLTVKHVSPDAEDKTNSERWTGTRVFRRWIQVPDKINGYATKDALVTLDLRFRNDDSLTVTIFSNEAIVYRGDEDNFLPVVLTEHAQPGQKFLVAVRAVAPGSDPTGFIRSELRITPHNRIDPAFLRTQILAARPVIAAYEDGKAQREQQLTAAVKAIDFSPLERGDQAGFEVSLKQAQAKLEELRPWLQQFNIRIVGNSHIDMAWLWPWTETVEVVRNTFNSVLDLMREYPDFKFTMSSARTYEWIQEKYPDIFKQIEQRVKEGRWEIIGGMWVEPDLNMPDGESLVRQILVGKTYFQKNFGVDVKIGWNPDSFGYNYQLPQIYKKSGMDYFVTQKLLWAHEFTVFPYKLFWWQSPDGSRLLTYFPHDYAGGIDAESLGKDLSIWMPSIYGKAAPAQTEMMHLYGVGDHGGGPTRVMLDTANRLSGSDSVFPKLEFSFARDFFSDMEKKLPSMQVPTWDGELYFQYHRGVFTTQAETKRRIRRAEENVLNAEKFASLASLYGKTYPQDDMELTWKNLLFDHFHDIMPGSGIAVNYLDAKRNLDDVDRAAHGITDASLHELAAHVNTQGNGTPIMLFNSLSWPRTAVSELEVQLSGPAKQIEVVDSKGKPAEAQLLSLDPDTHRAKLLLLASTPSFGYQTYFARSATDAPAVHSMLTASADMLENEFIRVKIDPKTGCMTSLFDKRTGTEALAPSETDTGGPKNMVCGNLLQTFVDKPKEYDAWNIDANFEKQHWDLDKADSVRLVESGALRAIIEVKNHFQSSTFVRDITLYAGVPRVDVTMRAEWHEKHILLKVAFPISVHSDKATYEIPFGSVERPTTRNNLLEQSQFEVPAQRWADLSDAKHGLSLLNDCKYGYDDKGNVLRLSLLRSPDYPDPNADEGHHEFTYSVYPHSGSWKDGLTIRQGYELNYKLIPLAIDAHQGTLPGEHSFVQALSDNVIITSLKKAEDDSALVLRFYEWAGKESDVTLQIPVGAESASETNLMEKPIGSLPVHNGAVTVHTKPFEIKTLKIQFAEPHTTASTR